MSRKDYVFYDLVRINFLNTCQQFLSIIDVSVSFGSHYGSHYGCSEGSLALLASSFLIQKGFATTHFGWISH